MVISKQSTYGTFIFFILFLNFFFLVGGTDDGPPNTIDTYDEITLHSLSF